MRSWCNFVTHLSDDERFQDVHLEGEALDGVPVNVRERGFEQLVDDVRFSGIPVAQPSLQRKLNTNDSSVKNHDRNMQHSGGSRS